MRVPICRHRYTESFWPGSLSDLAVVVAAEPREWLFIPSSRHLPVGLKPRACTSVENGLHVPVAR